jgi:integrase
MSHHSLQTAPSAGVAAILLEGIDNKDMRSRLQSFLDWLSLSGDDWRKPDLAAYRDWLMSSGRLARDAHSRVLQPAPALCARSAAAHLASVRGRYQALLASSQVRADLYALTPADASPGDRKAFVDEMLSRLANAIHPRYSAVPLVTTQDIADDQHLRLTVEQARALLAAPVDDPGNTPLQAVRDAALIALLLCTGIRDMELCALDVCDLRRMLGGKLALEVRSGKGRKQRLIPYGALDWCLVYLDKWLSLAGIAEGAVFRGFYRGGHTVRATRLTTRAVQDILNKYPISFGGDLRALNPHDTRRSYARLMHDAGMTLLAIQQNLGHSDSRLTEGYIGRVDAEHRQPGAVFSPPNMKRLESLIRP